ncbi:Hypothetical predicted protein [Paramuricea clavata]|uniref:Uncharacterized protein n=1 Tax=Paramuricea clavata TaxID=317549 RepID=A0A6S7JYE9_PARCT|nr:Hypothetical predicted protein [Paramuricea clavata]
MSIHIRGNHALIGNKRIFILETEDGTIYFAAKELATALGYKNTRDAIIKHTDERSRTTLGKIKGVAKRDSLDTPGGEQPNRVFVTESGVYELIFGSRLPSAREFKWWVVDDVLPSIRKTGKYMLPGVMPAIDNVKDEGLRQLPCSEQPEARSKLVHKSNIVKDLKAVLRGKKGGLVAQEKIRQTKKDLEKKEFQEIKERMYDTKKEVVQDLYDAVLLTSGVVGISYAAKMIAGKNLGAPLTLEGAIKLGVAVAGSSVAIAYLKDKGYVPKTIGAGFLFSHLNQNGYKEEVKRHNRALEELATAKEKFYESEVKRRNEELRRRQEILDANHDIEETNKALDELRNFSRRQDLSALDRKPKFEDYYQPSDEMQKYLTMTVGILGVGGGYVLTRIF